jgi:hypothetical protein
MIFFKIFQNFIIAQPLNEIFPFFDMLYTITIVVDSIIQYNQCCQAKKSKLRLIMRKLKNTFASILD